MWDGSRTWWFGGAKEGPVSDRAREAELRRAAEEAMSRPGPIVELAEPEVRREGCRVTGVCSRCRGEVDVVGEVADQLLRQDGPLVCQDCRSKEKPAAPAFSSGTCPTCREEFSDEGPLEDLMIAGLVLCRPCREQVRAKVPAAELVHCWVCGGMTLLVAGETYEQAVDRHIRTDRHVDHVRRQGLLCEVCGASVEIGHDQTQAGALRRHARWCVELHRAAAARLLEEAADPRSRELLADLLGEAREQIDRALEGIGRELAPGVSL